MKIGDDVLKFKKRRKGFGPPPKIRKPRHYDKLLREINKIKKVEQLSIVKEMIENAYSARKITFEERAHLYSKLNDKASKVGERKARVSVGPMELGMEKKGSFP